MSYDRINELTEDKGKSDEFLAGCIFALFLAACAGSPYQAPPAETSVQSGFKVPEEEIREYTLGAGDKLRIIVFDEAELSGEFLVDGSGMVSMPLIGEIEARGTTVREFQRNLEAALRDGYLNDPRVSAEVLSFRPYYILGEVNTPGEFAYSDNMTVLKAVAVAGGFTYRANQKVVYIRRDGEEAEIQYPLNSTTLVRPGDTIRVAERIF